LKKKKSGSVRQGAQKGERTKERIAFRGKKEGRYQQGVGAVVWEGVGTRGGGGKEKKNKKELKGEVGPKKTT